MFVHRVPRVIVVVVVAAAAAATGAAIVTISVVLIPILAKAVVRVSWSLERLRASFRSNWFQGGVSGA